MVLVPIWPFAAWPKGLSCVVWEGLCFEERAPSWQQDRDEHRDGLLDVCANTSGPPAEWGWYS